MQLDRKRYNVATFGHSPNFFYRENELFIIASVLRRVDHVLTWYQALLILHKTNRSQAPYLQIWERGDDPFDGVNVKYTASEREREVVHLDFSNSYLWLCLWPLRITLCATGFTINRKKESHKEQKRCAHSIYPHWWIRKKWKNGRQQDLHLCWIVEWRLLSIKKVGHLQ